MELEQVAPEPRPPSRYLKPGRMPSGNRHNLLEPLEAPAGAPEKPATQSARWDRESRDTRRYRQRRDPRKPAQPAGRLPSHPGSSGWSECQVNFDVKLRIKLYLTNT